MERKEITWASNCNKLGPTHEFSPDLNPDWIQKQLKGLTQIWHGIHIKFKLGFQSSFKSRVLNKIFYCGTRNFLDLNPKSPFELRVPNMHLFKPQVTNLLIHRKKRNKFIIVGHNNRSFDVLAGIQQLWEVLEFRHHSSSDCDGLHVSKSDGWPLNSL